MPQAKPKTGKRPLGPIRMPEQNPVDTNPPVPLDDKATMDLNGQVYEVRASDLVKVKELGRGAYGVVETMVHPPSEFVMAVKRIHTPISPEERKRMKNEVAASIRSEKCPYMVRFYGAMFREGDVWICMEVMDTSLDKLLNMCSDQHSVFPERILGKVAYSVVMALNYMKVELELMHRDVKPSNILVNRQGQTKICDYGISGHLTNSVAKTMQAGCKPYMAPERVHPDPGTQDVGYDIRSDVWSLGITMLELATRRHPFEKFRTPFEQLRQVVEQPPPSLPPDAPYSPDFRDFITKCLMKKFKERPKYDALLRHPFIVTYSDVPDEEVGAFVSEMLLLNEARARELASFVERMDLRVAEGASTPLAPPGHDSESPELADFVHVNYNLKPEPPTPDP